MASLASYAAILIITNTIAYCHCHPVRVIMILQAEPQQMWDCEAFTEMLVAYLPQSEGIPVS